MINFKQLLKIKDTREAQARGAAFGFFWGTSIFWGAQILGAVITAQIFKGNKVIAAALTAISNPLTTIPLYTVCYFIGHLIIPGPDLHLVISKLQSFSEMINLGADFFMTMLLGTSLVGFLGAWVIYYIVRGKIRDSVDTLRSHHIL